MGPDGIMLTVVISTACLWVIIKLVADIAARPKS